MSNNSGNIKHMLRALYDRNYRLFFTGQGFSAVGTWMQNIAMSWLIYQITGSAWMLGLVAFMSQIPNFILAPIAGIWVDRWSKGRILIITQVLSLVQASLLALLTLNGVIEIWHILWLSLFMGCVNALDVPARHAITAEMMTNQSDKQNAIAINSITFNAARLLGPAAAGILIPLIGEGYCFLLNSASYCVSILSLIAMKLKQAVGTSRDENIIQCFKDGFWYTFGQRPLRNILLLLGLVSLTAGPYAVILPVFVTKYLAGDAQTLGYLIGVAGLGSLAGAVFLAAQSTFLGLDKLVAGAAGLIGISLIGFVFVPGFWLCTILMFCLGIGFILQIVGSNTLLQSMVDDSLRGRIMSFYTMILMGVGPMGCLLAGGAVSRFGVINAFVAGGVFCLIGALLFISDISAFRKQACPIYVKSGSLDSYDQCRF